MFKLILMIFFTVLFSLVLLDDIWTDFMTMPWELALLKLFGVIALTGFLTWLFKSDD